MNTIIKDIDPTTIDPDTFEVRFIGKSGVIVTIDRYGVDDYSVWVSDDVTDSGNGCSIRGSLLAILSELKEEIEED